MGKKIKKVQEWIYRNLVWILLLGASFLFSLSKLDLFGIETNSVLEKLSFAITSSGVFAAVLKSIQFQGIFKREIEDIILGDKFIETRQDKNKLWKSVSKAIYNKKFPGISDELNNIVLKKYFPRNHNFYYDDFRYTLNIEELTTEGVIKFTQTFYYNVILGTGVTEATLNGDFTIDKRRVTGELVNKREYFKINGIDKLNEIMNDEKEDAFEKKTKYSITVPAKKKFLVEVKDRREYSIFEDNFKTITVNSITREMDVSITHPDNMTVSFFDVGVLDKFERKHVEHENKISRVHKKGLILPCQGFGITFGLKKL